MRILVFGAGGMLGSAMFRILGQHTDWQVFGTLRSKRAKQFFSPAIAGKLVTQIDVDKHDALVRAFAQTRPDVVINCIGLTKHHEEAEDPILAIPVNALLPHRMADLCAVSGARLVHVSTDCVFSGSKGNYSENDPSDATDVYGKSKFLGEVNYPHAVTLRTSIIGHELQSAFGLLEWFRSRDGSCKGFSRAIFSGLPTAVLTRIVRDVVLTRPDLRGLYHVGASPIDKNGLLRLIARVYGKSIEIVPDDKLVVDRSLNSTRFTTATGYVAPGWQEMIEIMHADWKTTL